MAICFLQHLVPATGLCHVRHPRQSACASRVSRKQQLLRGSCHDVTDMGLRGSYAQPQAFQEIVARRARPKATEVRGRCGCQRLLRLRLHLHLATPLAVAPAPVSDSQQHGGRSARELGKFPSSVPPTGLSDWPHSCANAPPRCGVGVGAACAWCAQLRDNHAPQVEPAAGVACIPLDMTAASGRARRMRAFLARLGSPNTHTQRRIVQSLVAGGQRDGRHVALTSSGALIVAFPCVQNFPNIDQLGHQALWTSAESQTHGCSSLRLALRLGLVHQSSHQFRRPSWSALLNS